MDKSQIYRLVEQEISRLEDLLDDVDHLPTQDISERLMLLGHSLQNLAQEVQQ